MATYRVKNTLKALPFPSLNAKVLPRAASMYVQNIKDPQNRGSMPERRCVKCTGRLLFQALNSPEPWQGNHQELQAIPQR